MVAGVHAIGNFVLSVSNSGLYGHVGLLPYDYFTGLSYDYVSEYPKFSNNDHFRSGTFWIGGVLDGDTLVSQGFCATFINNGLYELWPDPLPGGGLKMRTILDPTDPEFEEAVSEQDIIAVYTDTVVEDWTGAFTEWDTKHQPLYIEVTQRSYAWSSAMADDFILFNLTIKNIGEEAIQDAYFGVVMRPQVGFNITYG